MEFLKSDLQWTRKPRQVEMGEDRVVIITEKERIYGRVRIMDSKMIMRRYYRQRRVKSSFPL